MKKFLIVGAACAALAAGAEGTPAYLDTSRSFEERAADLVSQMTLDEKFGQLGRNTMIATGTVPGRLSFCARFR